MAVRIACALLLLAALMLPARADVVPQQQTWYLLMVDRFFDGDPSNNAPEPISSPDRSNWKLYWGGDLKGVTQKLGYLQALGVTTIWMTPIIKNADAVYHYDMQKVASYHGYWPLDDGDVNPYFGTMQDFEQLVAEAHKRHMKVVLDVVANHTSPIGQGADGALYDHGKLLATYDSDSQGWFHHNGSIDFKHATEHDLQTKNLFDLADLAQENPAVGEYLTRAYSGWVKRGVDGIRIDAARHIDPQWLGQFVRRLKQISPNLMVVAEWSGGGSDVAGAVTFEHETGAELIDFRMHDILLDQFTRTDANWQDLMWYLGHDTALEHPERTLVFLDNHDTPRFLSELIKHGLKEDEAKRRTMLAMQLLMVVRGIPCIYYDDEFLYHNESPTPAGGGADPFNRPMMSQWDTSGPFFGTLRRLADLRRNNPALGGIHKPCQVSQTFYAFERKLGDNVVLVAINKGPGNAAETFATSLHEGSYHPHETDGRERILGPDLDVKDGRTTVSLGPWQIGVWSYRIP